ncbi:hypothetical protein PanWU01x14_358350 [Parasponia andersonii]|uniref:Uncharacterized protein n=1 Tax=Parasponia andersonii TaxID=3476 RepID=A0A2P5A8D3_PARAD|nr:hypothetical protein PanWU01x14_358350 [Parasponia andersonii]
MLEPSKLLLPILPTPLPSPDLSLGPPTDKEIASDNFVHISESILAKSKQSNVPLSPAKTMPCTAIIYLCPSSLLKSGQNMLGPSPLLEDLLATTSATLLELIRSFLVMASQSVVGPIVPKDPPESINVNI